MTPEQKDLLVAELKDHPRIEFLGLAKIVKRDYPKEFADCTLHDLVLELARAAWNMR